MPKKKTEEAEPEPPIQESEPAPEEQAVNLYQMSSTVQAMVDDAVFVKTKLKH